MVRRSLRLTAPDAASVAALTRRFARVRAELGVREDFPPEVLDAARAAAAAPVTVDADLTDVPFLTVDPPGSTDLDQAMALRRRGNGFAVDYAIADVPAFVRAGDPVDAEAMRRGQTLYAPDGRVPLHPATLSEAAASLLPGVDRPALVWRFVLDDDGSVVSVEVVRAVVRSRARLDYAQIQAWADAYPGSNSSSRPDGSADRGSVIGPVADPLIEQALLLRAIGSARMALEQARGGASLPLPEQEIGTAADGFRLGLRPTLPAEDWNAQLSLMTGMAAAEIMLAAGVGLLRTLPGPDLELVARYRRQAKALGVPWSADRTYGQFLRGLDREQPAHLALMHEAGALFRGAGYTPLLGPTLPAVTTHAAVAAPYAHVTAPLRRLVDRFGLAICHAVSRGQEAPAWATEVLERLPAVMSATDGRAAKLERACLNLVEAAVLAPRVGESFDAVVVDVTRTGGKVQILEPVVLAAASGELRLGQRVRARLVTADPESGEVRFAVDGQGPAGPAEG